MIKVNKRRVRSFITLILALLIVTVPFYGCDSGIENLGMEKMTVGTYPVTVNDVEFKSQPQKVLVISPSLADVVIELGGERLLVAATVECTQRELEVLPKISISDRGAIIATGADLILAAPMDDTTRELLSDVDIPVFEVELANSREGFGKMYAQIATALMGDGYGYSKGLDSSGEIFITLDTISRETSSDTVTTACYLYDTQDKALTGDSFGSLMLEYAGLTNIFVHETNSYYSMNTLKTANPDIIFCDVGVKEQIMSSSNFSDIQAVKTGKVFELESSYVEWLGRRVIMGTSSIASMAFPELLEETDPQAADPTSKIEIEVENEMSEESTSSKEDTVSSSSELDAEYKRLEFGDSGDEVYDMQARLSELGYLTALYDGEYGGYTESAIEEFQRESGLTVTGVADSKTQEELFSDNAVPKPEDSSESQES